MKKNYEVKRDFRIGECNLELKKGTKVSYDDSSNKLVIGDKSYDSRNLKAAIKAMWLVPVDGKFPELDGPLGETEDQKMDRKRKERFEVQAKKKQHVKGLLKDEREVGVINEESEMFHKMLGAEPVASFKVKTKKTMAIIEDDTKEVGSAIVDDKETKMLKKALGQGKVSKKEVKDFEVVKDNYDAETVHVGKYSSNSGDDTLKNWPQMHWTKKAEVIQSITDSKFLEKLKTLETSKKIKERITEKMQELQ
jgi:hypothetical protein